MARPSKTPDLFADFIDQLATAVAARLGSQSRVTPKPARGPRKGMSAAGRERVRASQKKRWAKWRKANRKA